MIDRHSTTSIHAMSCEQEPCAEFFPPSERLDAYVSVSISGTQTDLTTWEGGQITLRAWASEHNRGALFLSPEHARHLAHSILAALDEAGKPGVAA
jgi:hypothetical protein